MLTLILIHDVPPRIFPSANIPMLCECPGYGMIDIFIDFIQFKNCGQCPAALADILKPNVELQAITHDPLHPLLAQAIHPADVS